jgi:hypothetical protein
MRIQIASDLHLEARAKDTFEKILEPAAPLLALLGDVAPLDHPNLRAFFEWCSARWETILWILGDVEFGRAPDSATAVGEMRLFARAYPNVLVLDHETLISSDGIYVVGLPYFPPPRVGGAIWNPMRSLYEEPEPDLFPPRQQLAAYNDDLVFLRKTLQSQQDPVVILSYRGPVVWLQEEAFIGDPTKTMTYPEMEQLLKPPLVAWLCGHVHQSVQFQKEWSDGTGSKGSVLLATNPRGRPLENLEYRRDGVIRIDPTLFRV